jgi:hypothetical protein
VRSDLVRRFACAGVVAIFLDRWRHYSSAAFDQQLEYSEVASKSGELIQSDRRWFFGWLNESQGYKWQVKLHCLRIIDAEKVINATIAGLAHGLERFFHISVVRSRRLKPKTATTPRG